MAYTPLTQTDGVFSVLSQVQDTRGIVASYALSRGVTKVQDKKYEEAIAEFKRAAAMQPDMVTAYTYMGRVYTMMGRPEDAVEAYQKAVKTDPSSADARADLGGAYIATERYAEAEKQFTEMVKLDRSSAAAHASLGYVAMMTERYGDAEAEFHKAAALAPRDPDVYYNLGLVYNKQKRYSEAVGQFEKAISLDRKYANAYSDLGFAYIALDKPELARTQADELWAMNTSRANALAVELEAAMYTPRIEYADTGASTFNPYLGPGAPLIALDPSLATPGAVKTFSMVFHFNQPMDVASVQNILNWSVIKSTGGEGGVYDNGVVLHRDREVIISPLLKGISYDPKTGDATVYFDIRQNEAGDGIIDPSHWVFRFFGKDVSGNPMDPRGDQWDGFSGKPY